MHLNSPCVGLFLSLQAYIFVFRYVFKNVFLYPFIVSVKVGFFCFLLWACLRQHPYLRKQLQRFHPCGRTGKVSMLLVRDKTIKLLSIWQ